MNENPEINNQEIITINNNPQPANNQNRQNQPQRLTILNQATELIHTSTRIYNQQGELQRREEITYEKSE